MRALLPAGCFFEVHVDTDLEECVKRDPKGMYKLALAGKIKDFSGIGSPYEPPERPELRIRTQEMDVAGAVDRIVSMLKSGGVFL